MQELQEQLFNFPVVAKLIQIGGKLFPVKGDFSRWSRQPFFCRIPGFPPGSENSLTVSGRWGTFAGDVLHGGFIELIAFNGAYLDESLLRLSIIVGNQVGTSKVELLWDILQDGGQLRYQLCKLDSLPYLVFSYTEKFCNQGSG